ncbi:MAG: thiamine phosphate synthase [Dehalococcoidia bacterium]|nr:thiamine phosphate synthase [Dehalococcoidia bacterium]
MHRLPQPCLMLITDSALRPGASLESAVGRAVAGGVNAVQVRDKSVTSGELLQLAQRLRAITNGKAMLIINDRADVAVACDADGVQLPEDGISPKVARLVMGREALVGCSVHSMQSALNAERAGADYLILGTIYPSRSHPEGPIAGVGLLKEVCQAIAIPVLAIGGVTKDNIAEVIENGAAGAAVISAVLAADDPKVAAQAIVQEMTRAWSQRPSIARQDK